MYGNVPCRRGVPFHGLFSIGISISVSYNIFAVAIIDGLVDLAVGLNVAKGFKGVRKRI